MAYTTERLAGGTLVFTSPAHAITTDALLLAAFCPVRPAWSACDLGSGCGILLLNLVDRGLGGKAVGVEQSPEGARLLQMAAAESGHSNVLAVCDDLRRWRSRHLFDLVVANPPYHGAGPRSPDARRAMARHQDACDIEQVAATASHLLKQRGRFCLCWPAHSLAVAFKALAAVCLAPKRLQIVRPGTALPARLVLIEARKGGGNGLTIEPDCV